MTIQEIIKETEEILLETLDLINQKALESVVNQDVVQDEPSTPGHDQELPNPFTAKSNSSSSSNPPPSLERIKKLESAFLALKALLLAKYNLHGNVNVGAAASVPPVDSNSNPSPLLESHQECLWFVPALRDDHLDKSLDLGDGNFRIAFLAWINEMEATAKRCVKS